jgi:hypothetical protein
MRSLAATVAPRQTTRAMRGLLYVLTGLTFFAGTQLFVLARHTETFFSWPIEPAMTAAFVGAGFWSASVISFWAARQPLWRHTRIPIPTILAVAFLLLVATLDHLETFEGLLGLAWIEVYAAFLPIMVAVVAMQLVRPGHGARTDEPLPRALRGLSAAIAVALVPLGLLLFADPDTGSSLWPWELSELSAKAIGTWLAGIGIIHGVVAVTDERSALPGNALADLVFAGCSLIALARFGGDVEFGDAGAPVFLAIVVGALAAGAWSALLCLREGRFLPARAEGGLPVELVGSGHADGDGRAAAAPVTGATARR